VREGSEATKPIIFSSLLLWCYHYKVRSHILSSVIIEVYVEVGEVGVVVFLV
jgi:hypothetical protein